MITSNNNNNEKHNIKDVTYLIWKRLVFFLFTTSYAVISFKCVFVFYVLFIILLISST